MGRIRTICLAFVLLSATMSWSQDKKQITIGMLGDKISANYNTALQNLQDEIRAVVGESATISFREILLNDFDIDKALANYKSLISSDVDIILSFGLVNNMAIYNRGTYPKPTLALGVANSDLITIAEGQNSTNVNNINFIIAPISYTKDLDAFYGLFDYRSIGIVIDELLLKNLPLREFFDSYFTDKSITYKFIHITDGKIINADLKGLDAVYIAGAYYMSDLDFTQMVDSINARSLPSFSAFGIRDLERGVLATNQPDTFIDNFFRRIALNIEAVIKGTNPSQLPLKLDYKEQLTLNYVTAKNIGFPLRFSAISKVDFIASDSETKFELKYSLLDIMSGVVDKNLALNAERKEIDLSGQDVKTAKSNFLPNVTANAGGLYVDPELAQVSNGLNPEFTTSGNVQLGQTIYSESAAANITIAEKQLEAQKESYNASELDAILNGAIAYFNALIFKTNVRVQNENLKTTRRNLEIAQLNFEVGESSKYDLLRFESELASNTQNFIDANRDMVQSLFTINQLLNNPIEFDIDIEQADIGQGIFTGYSYEKLKDLIDNPVMRPALTEFLVEEAKKNSPELKNIGFSLEANERDYKLNRSGRFIPTVSLQGQYSLEFTRSGAGTDFLFGFGEVPTNTYNVGLNVSLPIFQQNQRNINKQTTIILQDQLELFEQDTELAIEKNINDIMAELLNRIANIEISKVAEEAAKEALSLTQSSYAEGESLLIELVDAQNTYLRAQLSSANANYNYLLAAISLERSIGYFFLMNSDSDNVELMQRASQFILERN
jgi:outer membrane protein